jgi:SAM-dependent methyltransferase
MALLRTVYSAAPSFLKKRFRKYLYDELADAVSPLQAYRRFLNLGFVSDQPMTLLERDEPDRLSLQLYHELLKDVSIDGRDVLEVGCGKGGGCHYVSTYHKPASLTGIDLSDKNVAVCRREVTAPNVRFVARDAENTGLPAGSFDVVYNLESSHCYPSREQKFAPEVVRLLRPGGFFAYGDVLTKDLHASFVAALTSLGMVVRSEKDITDRVVNSLSQQDRDAALLAVNPFSWLPDSFYRNFVVTADSDTRRYMTARLLNYRLYLFHKPA